MKMRLETYKMATSILLIFPTLKCDISRTIWRIEVSDGSLFCMFHILSFELDLLFDRTFPLTILRIERSNRFDICSFCSTCKLNKLKITITSSFAKLPCNISESMLESIAYVLTGRFKSCCYCNMYQYSVIITVDTENAD